MELPLVARELRIHSNNRRTYFLRMLLGAVAFAFLSVLFISELLGQRPQAETVGRGLANIARVFQFGVAVFLPCLLTSGLIAKERQERTLGLLLLAESRGADVYLAKLLSPFLYIELLILSALPIQAFSAIFGGMSVAAVVLQTALFSLTALTVCTFGLLCSTLAKRTGEALFASILLVVMSLYGAALLAPFVAPSSNWIGPELHTGLMGWYAMDGLTTVRECLPGIGLSLLTAMLCAGITIRILPRQAYDAPARKRRLPSRRKRRRDLFGKRPLVGILARSAGGLSANIRSRTLKVFASIGLIFVTPLTCAGPLFVMTLAAYDVISSLDVARRSGIMDDLRLAATDRTAFVSDLFRAQFLRSLFYFPAFIFSGALGMNLFLAFALTQTIDGFFTFNGTGIAQIWIYVLAIPLTCALALSQLALVVAVACFEAKDTRSVWRQTFTAVLHNVYWIFFGGLLFGFLILVSTSAIALGALAIGRQPVWLRILLFFGGFGLAIAYFALCAQFYYSRFRKHFERFV